MEARGLSADNVAFGMGGALLQKVNRDTMRFAMKANAVKVNGEWRDVYKDPVTDREKRSKKGRLAVIECEPGNYQTIPEAELGSQKNILETVYRNGKLIREFSFDEVRENASR
jgi:nicotinamide phosphoribosyltransferase